MSTPLSLYSYINQTWSWEEAFCKFGFGDGDGLVMTHEVVNALNAAGYTATSIRWGLHNTIIESIIDQKGNELIPDTAVLGYDNPREYLPSQIREILDAALPHMRSPDESRR